MYAKDFIVNNGRERQIIEYFTAISPHIDRSKFSQTFVIEAVDLSDLPRFVVASY